MIDLGATIDQMKASGMTSDEIVRALACLQLVAPVPSIDVAAERRRTRDRDRKRILRISAEVGGNVIPEAPNKETSPEPPKEINPREFTPLKPPTGGRSRRINGYDPETYSEFEENVWVGFPRHPNSRKEPAFREYDKLPMESRADCIRGVMRYSHRFRTETDPKRSEAERLNYVPHLVTWIRQKGWESELERTH